MSDPIVQLIESFDEYDADKCKRALVEVDVNATLPLEHAYVYRDQETPMGRLLYSARPLSEAGHLQRMVDVLKEAGASVDPEFAYQVVNKRNPAGIQVIMNEGSELPPGALQNVMYPFEYCSPVMMCECVCLLLRSGPHVRTGVSMLHEIVDRQDVQMFQALVDGKWFQSEFVDVNERVGGYTALDIAFTKFAPRRVDMEYESWDFEPGTFEHMKWCRHSHRNGDIWSSHTADSVIADGDSTTHQQRKRRNRKCMWFIQQLFRHGATV